MKPSRHLSSTLWLSAFFILHSSLALGVHAQRADNRRLIWTGTGTAATEWSASSWKTSGSYLTYVNVNATSPAWQTTDALDATTFLAGDIAIFDSTGAGADPRAINIATEGITASEIILSGAGSYNFTGGAITTDAASVKPGSLQLTGTGSGMAATNVQPAGRLVKLNTGDLTLSNTAANHFAGGIHLAAGSLTIADNRALGGNNIFLLTASYATGSGIQLPAIVTDSNGTLLRNGAALLSAVTLRVPASADGLDITGSIFLGSQTLTLEIMGSTTISGRIYGDRSTSGANGGVLIKNGPGTLTLTGTSNSFYQSSNNSLASTNRINDGRLITTSPYAIGSGAWIIAAGAATLEFQGVKGAMKQSFFGGGDIEITQGSDLAFNWGYGTLQDYESMGVAMGQPADNQLATITVKGASRFSAIASGTYSGVLGGAGSQVFIRENSTLVLGREGISSRGTGINDIPITYPILARRISLTGASTLVLNPNAALDTGTLDFAPDSTIAFGASGVSSMRWRDGTTPAAIEAMNLYRLPAGMELKINTIDVTEGYHREYVVINHGANPLKDIAMTISALDAAHDTISARLADEFINPVTLRKPSRGRQWTNAGWARYIYSQFDYDNISITTPGITGRISGAVIGLDSILPDRFLLGLHAGAMDNNLATTNDTSLATKQRFLGAHAAQRFGKLYLALAADTGRVRTDSLRNEPASLVRGKWDTSYYSATADFGATLSPWAKTILRPHAGLRYTKLKISDYYERGPSPLLVENFNDTCVQAVYGLAAGRQFTLFKRDLAIDLALARKQTVSAPRSTLGTHYLDSPGTPIALERGDYYSPVTSAGLSLRMAMTRQTYAGFSYDYETASTHTRFTITALVGCSW